MSDKPGSHTVCVWVCRLRWSHVVVHTNLNFFPFFHCFQTLIRPAQKNFSAISIVRRAVCSCVAIRPQDCYLGNRLQLQKNPSKIVYSSFSPANKNPAWNLTFHHDRKWGCSYSKRASMQFSKIVYLGESGERKNGEIDWTISQWRSVWFRLGDLPTGQSSQLSSAQTIWLSHLCNIEKRYCL